MRASPPGTSQRYGLTHCHPGQIRNAYPKHNQADQARLLPRQPPSLTVTDPAGPAWLPWDEHLTASPCNVCFSGIHVWHLRR